MRPHVAQFVPHVAEVGGLVVDEPREAVVLRRFHVLLGRLGQLRVVESRRVDDHIGVATRLERKLERLVDVKLERLQRLVDAKLAEDAAELHEPRHPSSRPGPGGGERPGERKRRGG